jgi:hypothetical protein
MGSGVAQRARQAFGQRRAQALAQHGEQAAALRLDQHAVGLLDVQPRDPRQRQRRAGVVEPRHRPVTADVQDARAAQPEVRAQRAVGERRQLLPGAGPQRDLGGQRQPAQAGDPVPGRQPQRNQRRHHVGGDRVAQPARQRLAHPV